MSEVVDLEVGRMALRTFRYWKRASGEEWLIPMGQTGDLWAAGVCKAACMKATMAGGTGGKYESSHGDSYHDMSHEAPQLDCNCGIYGSLTYDSLRRQYNSHMSGIITVMAAEGKTVIGTRGLRTQFARIVAYWAPDERYQRVAAYQFGDATPFQDIHTMLETYGFPPLTYGPLPKDNWEGWTA